MATPPPLHVGQAPQRRPDGASTASAPHTIALKVMRLLRPELRVEDDIYVEEGDVCAGVLGTTPKAASAQLCLPPSIGVLHEGEMFRILLSLHNIGPAAYRDVTLEAEVHSPERKGAGTGRPEATPLADIDRAPLITQSFAPHDHRDYVMDYPVVNEGWHTLLCHVSYLDGDHRRSFKKTFRFEVHRTVTLKDVSMIAASDRVLVHSSLQNVTRGNLLVDLNFCPARGYTLLPLPCDEDAVQLRAMSKNETRNYLFQLERVTTGHPLPPTLGRMEITWCGRMGEKGRLETTAIQLREDSSRQGAHIDVTDVRVPDTVRIHERFTIAATITNTSPQREPLPIALALQAERMHPLTFTGPNVVSLGTIPYGASVPVELQLIAVAAGIQDLRGIEVWEGYGRPHQVRLAECLTAAHINVTG